MADPSLYTVGGTVQAGSGLYIPRQADADLLKLCRAGAFAYILTSRQMGKSSLMVRTAEQLAQEGIVSVIMDLTQLGVQLTAEEWYLGLLTTIEDSLALKTNAVQWWQNQAQLGLIQRLTLFFQKVLLAEVAAPVVIFIDEIDSTLSLRFTDDFYAAIRFLYNARAVTPEFRRLSFVLIGVATPSDLISDPERTPFNIGQRVDLADFTLEEALPLAEGFNLPPAEARQLLSRVLTWTGGHPYLTQRLCQVIAEQDQQQWSETDLEQAVAQAFFGRQSDQDHNLRFVHDMLTKRAPDPAEVLAVYRDIRLGQNPVQDEEQSPAKSHLRLAGVVRRERDRLIVRNRIYAEVFNPAWLKQVEPVYGVRHELVGKNLGQYQIESIIAEGSSTTVFKAYQPRLNRYAVIKVLRASFSAADSNFSARFLREVQAIARLDHPRILPIYDFGVEQDYAYTVVRYVEREQTLKGAIQDQSFNQAQAVAWVIQVAEALAYAHQHGVIHGNVKPANILLDNGQALLSDFGLLKIYEAATKMTSTGSILGTPVYMSPEQASGLLTDARSDLYSLGLILYELLTGKIPHDASTPFAIILERVTKPPPPPRTLNPAISEYLEQVLFRVLATKPEDRYQTAADFINALQATAKDEPMASSPTQQTDDSASLQPPAQKTPWHTAWRSWFK
ncbi:MAG: hypothetical protein Fur0044_46150 [Anaerolineae bacterium]